MLLLRAALSPNSGAAGSVARTESKWGKGAMKQRWTIKVRQPVLKVPIAEGVAQVPAQAKQDNLWFKVTIREQGGSSTSEVPQTSL